MIDLDEWAVTLPVAGPDGWAAIVRPPDVATLLSAPWFEQTPTGLHLAAACSGAAAPDRQLPCCTMQEVAPPWSTVSGTHRLLLDGHCDDTPGDGAAVVLAAVHDEDGPVLEVVVETRRRGRSRIVARHRGTPIEPPLVADYRLGDTARLHLAGHDGRLVVGVNGTDLIAVREQATRCRFVVGCQLASGVDDGHKPDARGEVTVVRVTVEHRP